MSVRNTILDNIKTELDKISKAAGYSGELPIVTRNAIAIGTLAESSTPAIWIDDSGEETPYLPVSTNRRQSMPVTLRGGVIRTESLSEVFNDLIADVKRVLHAADFGTNVIDWEFGPLRVEAGDKAIYFEYELMIDYYYPEATP